MATSGLYEWLDKVLRENGVFGEQAENGAAAEAQTASHTSHRSKKKGEGEEKQLIGNTHSRYITIHCTNEGIVQRAILSS